MRNRRRSGRIAQYLPVRDPGGRAPAPPTVLIHTSDVVPWSDAGSVIGIDLYKSMAILCE